MQNPSSAGTIAVPAAARATRVRFLIIAMIFIVTTLNNADRAVLSITASAIQKDFGIDAIGLGYLFSSFAWAYMLAQIPGGWLMDRFGSKRVYAVSIFVWSLFTFMGAFVPLLGAGAAYVALFLLRVGVGAAEGPSFPGNSRIVATWFPAKERGTAAAIFNSGQYFATVAFTPFMGWIAHSFGWPHVYFVMGGIGIVVAGVWLLVIHTPANHPLINDAELDYLRQGGAIVDIDGAGTSAAARVSPWDCLRQLLASRMMIGIYVGQYFITTLVYFFLTWFPIYLVKGLGMNIMQAGFVAAIPAVFGFFGGILGGVVSDALLRQGRSTTFARKVPIVVGMLLGTSIVACTLTSSPNWVVAFAALSLFGKGIGSLGWAVVSDTSPKEAAGLSGALFNTFANLAGITTPIIIGYIVGLTGSFNWALVFVAANAVLAALAFLLIVGPIHRFELRGRPAA